MNWATTPEGERRNPDANTAGLDPAILDATTIQNFAANLLGRETASMLFERGMFGSVSSSWTAYAISFHILALTHIALARVLVPVYYAYKDTRTPVLIAFVVMVINVAAPKPTIIV